MNRIQAFAILLLAAWPSVSLGQASVRDLLDAHERASKLGAREVYEQMRDMDDYRQAGWRAIAKGYYDTAEHEFRSAVKAALRPGLYDPRLTARSYADYAWALQKQGRNTEAEPLLKWALVAREKALEPGTPAIAQTLNQLGTLYYESGRVLEAETTLQRAIEVQAATKTPDRVEQSRSQTLMGILYSAQRRYAEAEPYFARAATFREKALGSFNADTADAQSNLAWTYLEQGKDDEAKPLFDRALATFERTRGEADPSVAHAANGLGQILVRQHNPAEAEKQFRRAIEILEVRAYEEPTLFEVLRHYADLLEDQKKAAELAPVKARLAPLRAKYTPPPTRLGSRYRVPEPSRTTPGPAGRVPG
jgi:tetratricopeptide (TPR) repeat protein